MADRDRAELTFVGEITDDSEHGRQLEIKIVPEGLRIDGVLLVPWEWIERARSALEAGRAGLRTSSDAQGSG